MTRSTNMEHVEVLRDLSEVCRAAIKAGDWKVDGACDPDSLLRHADAAIASLSAPQSRDAESKLADAGVFAGHHGLRGLADADEFWEKQPYGTRLYYGDGGMDYLHRGVLQKAVEILDAAPQPPAEAHEDEVVCLECGQPTMPMGQVCYACSHPAEKPAEAQAQGGGEAKVCDCVGWQRCDMCVQKLAYPPITAPPSAPVGVPGLSASLRDARERMIAAMGSRFGEAFDGDFDVMRDAADALAQQPAALRIAEPVLNRATPGTREAEMAVLETDENGVPTIWCDPEIADLVRALNVGGVRTVASCSGHGERLGSIALADGRALVICSSPDEAIAVIRSHEGQQPAAVDGAMVERAARAWCAGTDTPFDQLPDAGKARCLEDMRVVLTAALATNDQGPTT